MDRENKIDNTDDQLKQYSTNYAYALELVWEDNAIGLEDFYDICPEAFQVQSKTENTLQSGIGRATPLQLAFCILNINIVKKLKSILPDLMFMPQIYAWMNFYGDNCFLINSMNKPNHLNSHKPLEALVNRSWTSMSNYLRLRLPVCQINCQQSNAVCAETPQLTNVPRNKTSPDLIIDASSQEDEYSDCAIQLSMQTS